jgi:hypothetical protein
MSQYQYIIIFFVISFYALFIWIVGRHLDKKINQIEDALNRLEGEMRKDVEPLLKRIKKDFKYELEEHCPLSNPISYSKSKHIIEFEEMKYALGFSEPETGCVSTIERWYALLDHLGIEWDESRVEGKFINKKK